MTTVLGHQLLAEFWGCEGLDDVELAKSGLRRAIEASGATLIQLSAHAFHPYGVSAIAVISESHVAIHTWPEYSYAAADVFTCGHTNSEAIIQTLVDTYHPARVEQHSLDRGILGPEVEQALALRPFPRVMSTDAVVEPEREPFGWEVAVDLQDCDAEAISDDATIRRFLEGLCDDVLDMKRVGAPLIARFGTADPKTAGYSAVQLIETSSVVAHFSEERRSAYIDVFSCRPYDAERVEDFAYRAFGANRMRTRIWVRE